MIEATEVEIEDSKDEKLRIWMAASEGSTLEQIIRSKIAFHQAQALGYRVKAKDIPESTEQEKPPIEKAADGSMRQAQRFTDFLEIWKELREQEEHFTLTKLSC